MNLSARFGQNLMRHRDRVGISQEELGMRAELHRTAVGQLERGQRIARVDTLVKLAGSLGIQPELLLEGLTWKPSVRTIGSLHVADIEHESSTDAALRPVNGDVVARGSG